MNRLSPLIVRRSGQLRLPPWPIGRGAAAASPLMFAGAEPAVWLDDLKLFATGWIGGLVFFGTLLG